MGGRGGGVRKCNGASTACLSACLPSLLLCWWDGETTKWMERGLLGSRGKGRERRKGGRGRVFPPILCHYVVPPREHTSSSYVCYTVVHTSRALKETETPFYFSSPATRGDASTSSSTTRDGCWKMMHCVTRSFFQLPS